MLELYKKFLQFYLNLGDFMQNFLQRSICEAISFFNEAIQRLQGLFKDRGSVTVYQ